MTGSRILVLNAGSSSLKASLVEDGRALQRADVAWGVDASLARDPAASLGITLASLREAGHDLADITAVGHRVVHGGPALALPAFLGEEIMAAIEALGDLAPLHNRVALETARAARIALPGVPHVACFDTGFHADLPETVRRYPLPRHWYTEWGVRRYGFHGLSVEWATLRAAELLGRPRAELRLVVAHLGSGCSVTAVMAGRSVATSMGLTPLEGLMMGTRAGSIDPGILLYLQRTGRADLDTLTETLDHGSGLLGVSGRSSDVRELEAAADGGDEDARLTLEMFTDRAAAGIAAAATALPELDALVFSGGIGENAGRLRAGIVERLAVLGIEPIESGETGEDRVLRPASADPRSVPGPADDSTAVLVGRRPRVLRVEAREDLVIARHVLGLLDAA